MWGFDWRVDTERTALCNEDLVTVLRKGVRNMVVGFICRGWRVEKLGARNKYFGELGSESFSQCAS